MKFNDILGINARNRNFVVRMNPVRELKVADLKSVCKDWLVRHGLPTPDVLGLLTAPSEIDAYLCALAAPDGFVVKPDHGRRGLGVRVVSDAFGPHLPVQETRSEIRWLMRRILAGEFTFVHDRDLVLVEERVQDSEALREACGYSGSDVRVINCQGDVVLAMLRIPTRNSKNCSNLHKGAVGVGIDMETGETLEGIYKERAVVDHPDTGRTLAGIKIPGWKTEVLPLAKKIARDFPLPFHGIDMMFDRRKGPQIMEVNARPGLAIQLANRAGLQRLLPTLSSLLAVVCLTLAAPELRAADADAEEDQPEPAQVEHEGNVEEARAKIQATPEDAVAHNDLAVKLYRAGDAREAKEMLARAIELDPSYARAHHNLGSFFLFEGRLIEAQKALEEAVRHDPYYTAAHFNLGLAFKRQERFAEAAHHFEAITKISKSFSHYISWHYLGVCQMELGKDKEAIVSFEKTNKLNPAFVPSRIKLGAVLARSGHLEQARVAFEGAQLLDKNNWRVPFNLATALKDAERFEEAREVLGQISEADSERPEVLGLSGALLLHMGRANDAVHAYGRAYQASRKLEHLYNLGKALTAANQKLKAVAIYRSVLQGRPDYDEAAFNLAMLYIDLKQHNEARKLLDDLLARTPGHAGAEYTLGNLLKDNDKLAEAFVHLKRAVEFDPENARYLFGLALAQKEAGDIAGAIESYKRAERADPTDPKISYNLGISYLDSKAEELADAAFGRALAIQPDYYGAVYNRGLGRLRADQLKGAVDDFKRALELKPRNPRAWNNLGRAHSDLGEVAQSAQAYSQAIELDKTDATAYFNLAVLYRRAGKAEEAEEIYRRALDAGAASPKLLNNLGLLELKESFLDAAERMFRAALEMNPSYSAAAVNLCGVLSKQGRAADAAKVLQPFLEKESATPELFFNAGLACMRSGDLDAAVRRFSEALNIAPDYVEARHNLGLAYLRMGMDERAERVLAPILAKGVDAPRTLLNLALAHSERKEYAEAEEILRGILESNPHYALAQFNLGVTYLKQKKYRDASLRFVKAGELKSPYAEAWYNLGITYLRFRQYSDALIAFNRAVEQEPSYVVAWYNIGVAHSRMGNAATSVEAFRKAAQLAPENEKYLASLGRTLEAGGQYSEAADAFKRVLGLVETPDETVLSRYAYCLSYAKRYAEAETAFAQLVTQFPEDPKHKFNYAVLKTRKDEFKKAGDLYVLTLEQDPNFSKARNNLAYIHMRFGRLDEAALCLKEIERSDPNYPNLQSSFEDLRRRRAGKPVKNSLEAKTTTRHTTTQTSQVTEERNSL